MTEGPTSPPEGYRLRNPNEEAGRRTASGGYQHEVCKA
jgi:hypothetical protein